MQYFLSVPFFFLNWWTLTTTTQAIEIEIDLNSTEPTLTDPLEDNPNFQVTYKGRFQSFLNGCEGPPPEVRAVCVGTVRLVNVSHPAIVCETTSTSELTCRTTCVDEECEMEVFRNDGSYSTIDGPWAEIVYRCEGKDVAEVDSYFEYLDTGDFSCDWRWFFDNEAYRISQLGVLCNVTDQEFVANTGFVVSRASPAPSFAYGHSFLECSRGHSGIVQGKNRKDVICATGRNCGTEECQVQLDAIQVFADLPRFEKHCIEPLNEDAKFEMDEPDEQNVIELLEGNYTLDYLAHWTVLMKFPDFWYGTHDFECYPGNDAHLQFVCTNGMIELLEASHSDFDCYSQDEQTVDCWVGGYIINKFGFTAKYRCTATNQVPATSVTYRRNGWTCTEENADEILVGHALQLGHNCRGLTMYEDFDSECGDGNQFFHLGRNGEPKEGGRFTCLETASVTRSHRLYYVPEVTIRSDWRADNDSLGSLKSCQGGFQNAVVVSDTQDSLAEKSQNLTEVP